jgi:2-methylisocitrate lyase-like PEP mutase family enzyme
MATTSASNIRKTFRSLLVRRDCVAMPGAYDALSARIIEDAGFEAIMAGGYAAIGSMLAQADMGQCNVRDYADHYARVCDAVNVPVYADADTGFGGVNNVREMIRAFERAGVAGIFISDQTFPNRCGYIPGKSVVTAEQMVARVKAALDARTDPEFVICARTDAVLVEGLDRGIERCQIYMEAGADLAKPQAVDTIPDIKRVVREVPCPHMATLSQAKGGAHMTLDQLDEAGVATASFPSIALFAAAEGVRRAVRQLKRDRSLENCDPHLFPLKDYYALVGLEAQLERERGYDEAAAALTRKHAAE